MPGGLLQLASSGYEDQIFIKNPTFTFFKIIYKKYSNFSFEDIGFLFKNDPKLGFGSTYNTRIPNNGDLLRNLILGIDLPQLQVNYINDIPTQIDISTNKNVYKLSPSYISYNLERFKEIINTLTPNNNYSTVPLIKGNNTNSVNVFNWLDGNSSLSIDTVVKQTTDKNKNIPNYLISPDFDISDNLFCTTLNTLNYSYTSSTYQTVVKQYYNSLNIQYISNILLNNNSPNNIKFSFNLFETFVTKLNNYIINNEELKLIKNIQDIGSGYTVSSLDTQNHSENMLVNMKFTSNTTILFEPLIYCYSKIDNQISLVDILVNTNVTNSNNTVTINTEKYINNISDFQSDVSNNLLSTEIYFIGSRNQILLNQDLNQILGVKYIKQRTVQSIDVSNNIKWDVTYTDNQDEAIEWEVSIFGNPQDMGIIPTWDISSNPSNIASYNLKQNESNIGLDSSIIEKNRNQYLLYIYRSMSTNDQLIKSSSGKFIVDPEDKLYMIDNMGTRLQIHAYIQNLENSGTLKENIPLIYYKDILPDLQVQLKYNTKYFLDASSNFIEIKDIYIDSKGNKSLIVQFPNPANPRTNNTYYVDPSGNYIGPISTYNDIINTYDIDLTPNFVIDLISATTQDSIVNTGNDISYNLIPVLDFINNGKTFNYIYKGRYYNYLKLYYDDVQSTPRNLEKEFLFYPAYCILTLQTYYDNILILKKLDLSGVTNSSYLYNTSELHIKDSSFNDVFVAYGDNMFNVNDISNNQVNYYNIYTISNDTINFNNQFTYYWIRANNNLIDPNGNTYTTFQNYQQDSLPYNLQIQNYTSNIINNDYMNIRWFNTTNGGISLNNTEKTSINILDKIVTNGTFSLSDIIDISMNKNTIGLNTLFTYTGSNVDGNTTWIYFTPELTLNPNSMGTFIVPGIYNNNTQSIQSLIPFRLINISSIQNNSINLDVYENYKFILNEYILNYNLPDYEIYQIIINYITTTNIDNLNILMNLFSTLFSNTQFFSQYATTVNSQIILQTLFIPEHISGFLTGIIGTNGITNIFKSMISDYWNKFKESQDLAYYSAISTIINSNSNSVLQVLQNNISVPTLQVSIPIISNTNILTNTVNITYANINDPSYNPVNISNIFLNKMNNSTSIANFIASSTNNTFTRSVLNNLFNNIDSDITKLQNMNIFDANDLSLNNFVLSNWNINSYNIDSSNNLMKLNCTAPSYQEFKKLLILMYISNNTGKFLGDASNNLILSFNISPNAIASLKNEKYQSISNINYIFQDNNTNLDTTYITTVPLSFTNNFYINTICIDLFRTLGNQLINLLGSRNNNNFVSNYGTNNSFLLYTQIYLSNLFWHLSQDILYNITTGKNTIKSISNVGNIMSVNNFSSFFSGTSIKNLSIDIFENYLANIKSLCIQFLVNKSFSNNKNNIRFYSVNLIPTFTQTYLDIELTNENAITVIQWLVEYLASISQSFYISYNKPSSFWTKFNNYKNTILTGVTLDALNFFLYNANIDGIISNTADSKILSQIMYYINELMMGIYSILDNQVINDLPNNISYRLLYNSNSKFGISYNLSTYSIYDTIITLINTLMNQIKSNYTYNYLINYLDTTRDNYLLFYSNIFNNISQVGLSTYKAYQAISGSNGFNWNDYIISDY